MEGQVRVGTSEFRRINVALFCAGFVTFVTLYDVQPLLPLFAAEFGVSPAVASLPLSFSTIALAVGMLIAGTVSETLGRRPVMTVALFLTSLLAVATLFSHSFESLLLLRLLQGLVLAGVPSVAMAYLGEEMDAQAVGHAMGLYISGNALGGMTGRIGSALLCEYVPWHSAIALIGVVSLLLSLVFLKSLPPSTNFHQRPFRLHYLFTSLLQHLHDPGLLCLYALAFLSMGGFISLYNYIGFRLLAPPYNLCQFQVSLIFLVYLLGSFSSGVVGSLIHRFGRPFMIRLTLSIMLGGTLITLFRIAAGDCGRGGSFYLRVLQRPCHRFQLGRQAGPDSQGPGIVPLPVLLLSRFEHFRYGGGTVLGELRLERGGGDDHPADPGGLRGRRAAAAAAGGGVESVP